MIGSRNTLLAAAIASFTPMGAVAQVAPSPAFEIGFWAIQGIGMLFLVVLAAMALFFISQREKRRQELIARFVDKGTEIPIALLPQRGRSREQDMSRGIWLLAWGVGIGIALYSATGDWSVASWALVLLCLSAASFLNAVLFSAGPRQSGGE